MAETTYVTQRLDHLGIVAGICQEIELAGQIDRMIGPTDRQVSVGEAVQAMVLNALGFVSRPLYLTPEFFTNKPLDRLLRSGLTAEMLNDDSLGRALDILYEARAHRSLRPGGFPRPSPVGHPASFCPPGHHLAQCGGGR
jgi:transposase